MQPRCLGLGRRSLLAGTTVRRRRRTRGLSFLSCVRLNMMPAKLAWRTCPCRYSAECVEGLFPEVRLREVLGSLQSSSPTPSGMLIRRRSLTQKEAAELAHVHLETLRRLESGERPPYMPTLTKIARGYGVSIEEVVE